MGKIQVLPDLVVNQISAGEVVERPASVVRELVDNSVDAGATDIAVYLEQGGQTLIRVVDNGSGMNLEDAAIAFERHATSKLRKESDLLSITTLGFRGEALPSIASISKVRMTTRTADSPTGIEVQIEGGALLNTKEVSCQVGTDFESRMLFFNTPARRKFLKQPRTEELKVEKWLLHSSLGHPNVRYRLFCDGDEILNLPAKPSLLERAKSLISGSYVVIEPRPSSIQVEGVVGHPALAQSDFNALVFLVNGRLIQDRALVKAVKDGFDSTLKFQEMPVGVISIRIPSSEVDVNVHPQKSEVRFVNSQGVFLAVREGVASAVRSFKSPVPGISGGKQPGFWTQPVSSGYSAALAAPLAPAFSSDLDRAISDYAASAFPRTMEAPPEVHAGQVGAFSSAPDFAVERHLQTELFQRKGGEATSFSFSSLRYVGQIMYCYLLCESTDSLVVVDMHAAHERYNFNLIRNSYLKGGVSVQELLVPITIHLGKEGVANLTQNGDYLKRFGIEVEAYGPTSIVMRAVPTFLKSAALETLLRELAAESYDGLPNSVQGAIDRIAARIACHASIRSGDQLSPEDVRSLFVALDSTDFSAACPHGRPVVVSFNEMQIERWFGRDR